MVAHYQFSASPLVRVDLRAVTLLAAVTWLTNCLHATPDTGPSSRQLLSVVLPLVRREEIEDRVMPFRISRRDRVFGLEPDEGFEDENRMTPAEAVEGGGAFRDSHSPGPYPFNPGPADNQTEDLVPAYLRGYMFLKGLIFDENHDVPMMPSGFGYLSEKTFKYMYGSDFSSFQSFVYRRDLFTKANPARNRNRVVQPVFVPPAGTVVPTIFDLPDGDLTLPDVTFGSIAGDDEGDDESDSGDVERVTRNAFVSKIYHQILVDCIATSPNPKRRGEAAYCYVRKEHIEEVDETIFKDRNMAKYFRAARMKVATPAEWKTAFNHLLPPPGSPPKVKTAQNYPMSPYYTLLWPHYIAHVPAEDALAARKAINKRLSKLAWIPWAKSDRIWEVSSKRNRDTTRSPGLDETMPAPHILCTVLCTWDANEKWVPKRGVYQVRPIRLEVSFSADI